ncbi:MAG: hypothetical protein SGI77_11155 [Pirellulaceae bacterium]|nr:hypothetical protein [Pirellulaceae bacterium]
MAARWQLDGTSNSSEFLVYTRNEISTSNPWSNAFEPYTSFSGSSTTHTIDEHKSTASTSRVTSGSGSTSGSAIIGELTYQLVDYARQGSGNYKMKITVSPSRELEPTTTIAIR